MASAKKAHSADKMNVAERYSEPGSGEMSAINSQNRHEFVKRKIRAADFATAMVRQMRDIDLLQEYAMTEDGKIKNPAVFERALALRERQMSSFIKTLAPTIDQLEWEDVSGAIIDTIAALDKEVSAQIMTALHNLRRQYNGGRG